MKYFNPSYWFKLWVLSAPLFNDKTQGINAKSINNKKIKDWASNNTTNISLIENQELTLSNNQTSLLNLPSWNTNLTTHNEKHRNRLKRAGTNLNFIETPVIRLYIENGQRYYSEDLNNIIIFLRNNDILREMSATITNVGYSGSHNPIYYINQHSQYEYFIIPITLYYESQTQTRIKHIRFVFRQGNLYLQGFIINNDYYYFSNSDLTNQRQYYNNQLLNTYSLRFSSDYNALTADSDPGISWIGIRNAFINIINYGENPTNNNQLRRSLAFGILSTAESMRFLDVRSNIISNSENHEVSWNWYLNIIRNWARYTGNIINTIRSQGNLQINPNPYVLTILTGIVNQFVLECQQNQKNLNRRNSNNILYCIKIEPKELYWPSDLQNKPMYFAPTNSLIRQKRVHTFNLGKINPIDNYNKLSFLGDVYSDGWGVKTKWGSWIYDGQPKNHKPEHTYDLLNFMYHRNYKFHDIIRNVKVNGDISPEDAEKYTNIALQDIYDYSGSAEMFLLQKMGFTWYWENENYYFQFIVFQYLDWRASYASLECWLKYGSGIKLYNDYSERNKRSIIVDNANVTNLESNSEKVLNGKNILKWNSNFTNSINNEQHLPIDNKTNFVTNNITSL